MHREMCWTLSHGIDTKITYGQRKQDNSPSCPFKHFLSISPDSDILPYSPYSLECCYCCTKNWWFISRLSIQFSHAPNYRVFVQLLTLVSLQFRNHHRAIRRFSTHFTLQQLPVIIEK